MLYPHTVYKWQISLPFDVVEDVIPHTSMLQPVILADVTASGRWNGYYRVVVKYHIVDVITYLPHLIWQITSARQNICPYIIEA